MASLVSAEASAQAHGHLHLDPSLEVQVPVKARCATCCPITDILKKIFCCCASNCCNTTEVHRDRVIYCLEDGTCVDFDSVPHANPEESHKVTAMRVKALVESEKNKRGSVIKQETGIDLDAKSVRGEPIRVRELKKLQSI